MERGWGVSEEAWPVCLKPWAGWLWWGWEWQAGRAGPTAAADWLLVLAGCCVCWLLLLLLPPLSPFLS